MGDSFVPHEMQVHGRDMNSYVYLAFVAKIWQVWLVYLPSKNALWHFHLLRQAAGMVHVCGYEFDIT